MGSYILWGKCMAKVSFEEEELIQIMTTSLCASFPDIDTAKMKREVRKAIRKTEKEEAKHGKRVFIKTFGNFDVFVDEKPVVFGRARAKELLAYLVDRQGAGITRAEAFALLWEDGFYDRPMQKQLDVIIRNLKDTLVQNGIGDILDMEKGTLRLVTEQVECDLYKFLEGDLNTIRSFRGEYMSAYSWASLTEAYVTRQLED